MPNATIRELVGEMDSKSKGKNFVKELNAALAPEKIAKMTVKKQPLKK
jgi:hypothetical protein